MEWIKSRWVIIVLICILVVTAAVVIVILFCQPHKGNFTNAWYVRLGGFRSATKADGLVFSGLTQSKYPYNIQFAPAGPSGRGGI